jgi:hypothetical protein
VKKMGVELHITRAEFWAENEDSSISCEEWVQLIERDPDLQLDTKNGEYHAVWSGDKKHDDHWLEWFQGNISTKWPRRALYEKMLEIASTLEAKVQDDDGSVYPEEADWSNPYEEGEKKQEVVEPEIEVHKEPTSKKRKHVELGMLSPFSRAAKKSPTHPIQCCGRYMAIGSK